MNYVSNGVKVQIRGNQGIRGMAGPDGNPIGTIINCLGKSAPDDYLICNGEEYDVAEYPKLAEYFEEQFGSKYHFGGSDDKFFVPNILDSGSGDVLKCIKATEAEPYEDIYSLEETVVGQWIDGKPVYRIAINANCSISSAEKVIYKIDNPESIISVYGYGEGSNNRYLSCCGASIETTVDQNGDVRIQIVSAGSVTRFVKNSWIIVEYTKTTDPPTISIPQTLESHIQLDRGEVDG